MYKIMRGMNIINVLSLFPKVADSKTERHSQVERGEIEDEPQANLSLRVIHIWSELPEKICFDRYMDRKSLEGYGPNSNRPVFQLYQHGQGGLKGCFHAKC